MARLEHPLKAEIHAVRAIILKANRKIAERVKWNTPSDVKSKRSALEKVVNEWVQLIDETT